MRNLVVCLIFSCISCLIAPNVDAKGVSPTNYGSSYRAKETTCLGTVLKDTSEARQRVLNLKARFLNTKDRTLAYIKSNGLLGGQISPYSDVSC